MTYISHDRVTSSHCSINCVSLKRRDKCRKKKGKTCLGKNSIPRSVLLLFLGFLIDIVGRLPLLIASTVFMSLALAGFGSYAYYMSQTQNLIYSNTSPTTLGAGASAAAAATAVVGQHDWIPFLCVLVFTTALALGISPISWLLIGELFPLEYRGLGSSISTSFSYFCAFIGIKLFIDFQEVSFFILNKIFL